jgi:DNA replication protein DnaC
MKHDELIKGLNQLRLTSMVENYSEFARVAEKNRQTYEQYLAELTEAELESKKTQRIQRLIKQANLPLNKEISHYQYADREGVSAPEIQRLTTGEFLKEGVNIVFYGDFGVGKTHLAIGLVKELCRQGYKCIYFNTTGLIDQLIKEKQELKINQFYKRLDRYDLIFCDELGYVPQTTEGANLFFQLISQRAERKSLMITTNLPYSEWTKVFLDEMTTQAAVDRIIHRCETFHIKGPSFRAEEAKKRQSLKRNLTTGVTKV